MALPPPSEVEQEHVQYAWRFDPCELGVQGSAAPAPATPRVEVQASDDEYLTEAQSDSDDDKFVTFVY